MHRLAALLPALALAGCVATEPAAPPAVPPAATDLRSCRGDAFVPMIGMPVADLQLAGLPTSARIIRPGDAVTMDYSAERRNVERAATGRGRRLTCG